MFLGWRRDVETVYRACDLLMITSDNEGMPVSLIEASSVGTPCVTTRVGSAPEVVLDGDTGFVTERDVGELARAAARLLDDPELRCTMGVAAGEHAARRFGAPRLVADIAGLYERIVSERGLV